MYPRLSCLRSFLPWLFQVLCIPKETASYAEAPCVFPDFSPFPLPLPRGRYYQKMGYLIQGPAFMLLLLICRDISSSYIGYSFPFFRPHILKVAFCTNLPAVFFMPRCLWGFICVDPCGPGLGRAPPTALFSSMLARRARDCLIAA